MTSQYARLRAPQHRVSPKAITLWTLDATYSWGSLAAVQGIVMIFIRSSWQIGALVATVIVGLVYALVMPRWRYRVHLWECSASAVYTQVGWLTVRRSIVPLSRVQTVEVEQDLLSRVLGLASVVVETASGAGSISIDGLNHDEASRLADDLASRTQATPGDAT